MNYVKYIDSQTLEYMTKPKGINLSDEFLAAYASERGYKELKITTATTQYHTKSYREYDAYVTSVWTKPALADLKVQKLAEADQAKETSLNNTAILTVEDVGDVLWNTRAEMNISGSQQLLAKGYITEVDYTLADDTTTTLNAEQVEAIALAMSVHVNGIYATCREARAAVEACTTTDELLEL